MTNISEARALITGTVSHNRKSGQNGDFKVIGKISPQDCGWEEFFVHLLGKMPLERPPIRSAKRAKCDDFSIDFSLRQEGGLVNDTRLIKRSSKNSPSPFPALRILASIKVILNNRTTDSKSRNNKSTGRSIP
jgi:hypothetical protein